MYTLEDLENAREELRKWDDRFDRYTGNNPDKYQSDIRAARSKLRLIESELKRTGALPMTDEEKLHAALDMAFPEARSKEIVEYQGKRYQRRYFPLEKSRSRQTVTDWGKDWVEVTNK